MNPFCLVLARDSTGVIEKTSELKELNIPFIVICGEEMDADNVIFRSPSGKYDAINYGFQHIPKESDVVIMNDVDTKIFNIEDSIELISRNDVGLVFSKVVVTEGPQTSFYRLLDFIRRRLPITSSGELMLVKKDLLNEIIPLKPCKAEDTYIMFKILEGKNKVVFSEKTYVITDRTKTIQEEEGYKRRTVGGIYQALSYSNPPFLIRAFYTLLPLASPLLLLSGRKGYYWMKGIMLGYYDYLKGDSSGSWKRNYC